MPKAADSTKRYCRSQKSTTTENITTINLFNNTVLYSRKPF